MTTIIASLEETFQYSILPLKNLTTNAEIWINFCKLVKNGVVQNSEMVYCIKCLEINGMKQEFPYTTQVSTLRNHLVSSHGLLNLQPEISDLSTLIFVPRAEDTEYLELDSETMLDQVLRASGQKGSSVWKYFEEMFDQKERKNFMYCKLCLKSDKKQRYQPSTATTNLMKHLKNHHRGELMQKVGVEETDQPDLKRTYTKTSNVWKYFCKLTKNEEIIDENHIYCAKCLEMHVNKKYKTTTSTGSLKKHLQLYHDIVPSGENEEESEVPGQVRGVRNQMSKARRYFHKLGSDQNHYYCLLCLQQKRYQK